MAIFYNYSTEGARGIHFFSQGQSCLRMLCGGPFLGEEGMNAGLEDTHVVGGNKHSRWKIVPEPSC